MRLATLLTGIVLLFGNTLAGAAENEVAPLVEQLEEGAPLERIHAAQRLGELGPLSVAAVPQLVKALHADEFALRHEAVIALGRISADADASLPALIEVLDSDAVILRHSAIHALRMFGPAASAASPKLELLKDHDDPLVSVAAAWALIEIDPDDEDTVSSAISVLVDGLQDSSAHTRNDASRGLMSAGAAAVPAVMELVDPDNPLVCRHACDTLASIGPEASGAVDKLLTVAKSDDDDVCWHSVQALGAIQAAPDRVVPALRGLLEHETAQVRAHAADALGAFGPQAKAATAALADALQDEDEFVRLAAAAALGAIGPAAADAIPALVAALDDPVGSVTLNAAEALAQIGAEAVPALIKRLEDPEYRQLAAAVLAEIGPEAKPAVPALLELLDSDDVDVRREGFIALAMIGPAAEAAVPKLIRILDNEDDPYRGGAAYALGRIGAGEALPALTNVVEAPDDPLLRLASAWALLQLDPDNEEYARIAVPRLAEALTTARPLGRLEAARTFAELGPRAREAVPQLREALRIEEDPEIRAEMLTALAEIGPDSRIALAEILPLTESEDPVLRNTAAYALGRIGGAAAQQATPIFRRLLRSRDELERTLGAWGLVKVAPNGEHIRLAVPLLAAALERAERPDVRVEVARTLGEIGGGRPLARRALAKAAENDGDESVREAAGEALDLLR